MEFFRSISNNSLAVVAGDPFCENGLEAIMIATSETTIDSNPRDAIERGTLTGVAVAVLINIIFSLKNNVSEKVKNVFKVNSLFNARVISVLAILTFLLIFLPVLFSLMVFALFYKLICILLIQRIDKSYAGLLDSFDVFWSLEDDSSKSIINVFGIIEADSPQALASSIKERLKTVINEDNTNMKKMFYRRSEKFGFYYWRRYFKFDLNEYVKIIQANRKGILEENDLQELMAEHSEKPLPYDDKGLFHILVTGSPVNDKASGVKVKKTYGLIIKIHHSLSDGVALIEFLSKNLADVNLNAGIFTAFHKQKQNTPKELLDKIRILIQMPLCLVKGIIRKPDNNALHGPALTGNKIFVWSYSQNNLLQMMKDLKANMEGIRYTDLLVTALSAGLRSYLAQRMRNLPEEVSVILPIRFPARAGDCLKLENNFSVTILDVPIKSSQSGDNISHVKTKCDQLRSSADPMANYYFLLLTCGVLPIGILKPMLVSKHATMVLSNLPGPDDALAICGGNTLKQLVFFVPNKGTTGLGVTALSYDGALRLAAAADRALVSSADDLRSILHNMVDEIKRLHRVHCCPCQ